MVSQKTCSQNDLELAKRFGIKAQSDLSNYPFVRDQVHIFPYTFVKKMLALPLEEKNGTLLIAIARPHDLSVIEEIRSMTGKKVEEVFCPESQLEEAIEFCYNQKETAASLYIQGLEDSAKKRLKKQDDEYDLLGRKEDSPVLRLLNMIMIEAIQQGASDIHFEPMENQMTVRYRIDGVLQFRHNPPLELQSQLITRIKVMAKMDIAEHRLPQDGRIKLVMSGRQIDFRVSVIPIIHGERIVLRILDKRSVILGLDKLGITPFILKQMRKYLRHNQGIILVTGPTGSGKTTTLYGSIADIQSEGANIMTIEDPVEYKFPGIAQMSVNSKIDLSFSIGLRHILRQDPDIIMIGEIRDKETAEIAIQSSLTGHLVLSTLHTNDAPSALTRLVDMGIEPYLLTSSVLAIVAQRLVRKICLACKKTYVPTNGELKESGLLRESLNKGVLFKGSGCSKCLESGYLGRSGIYELMPVCHEIKEQLLKSANASALQSLALKRGMHSLLDQGKDLAINGITTIEEVLRVTRQIEI